MAEAVTHKVGKRKVAGRRKAKGSGQGEGRIQVRRDTAEYRAAAQEQAAHVQEAIDVALAHGRRIREEIEAHIEAAWQNRTLPKATKTKSLRRRRRAKA